MPRKFYNGIDVQNQKIVNLADGSAATDGVTKQQLDAAIVGLSWKQAVRAATTATGTLASAYENGDVIDGVTLATGDRILLKNQSTGSENGIYTVNATGAPTRATDADSAAELKGATVLVLEGTVNGDKAYTQTVDTITLGSTSLVWTQFGGGGAYTASLGVTLVGSDFRAVADPTPANITVGAAGLSVTPGAFPKKYAANVGAMSAATSITITHNLGTLDVQVAVVIISTGEVVDLDVVVASTNTITLTSAAAVASGVLRVIVIG